MTKGETYLSIISIILGSFFYVILNSSTIFLNRDIFFMSLFFIILSSLLVYLSLPYVFKNIKQTIRLFIAGFAAPILSNMLMSIIGGIDVLRVYPIAILDSFIVSILLTTFYFVVKYVNLKTLFKWFY